jgi:EEF1A N-terminal glycine/lysine methyltransferase
MQPPTRLVASVSSSNGAEVGASRKSEHSRASQETGNAGITNPGQTVTTDNSLADELDFVTVATDVLSSNHRADKASRVLGIKHRRSMEPIPASARNSIVSTRSARDPPPTPTSTSPLTSLYVVSGLPKSPHTWTLADPDAVLGLHHTEGAVNRWWRPEVLGSTVSPGVGGTQKKKRRGKSDELIKGSGALSKTEVGKMLSKALKVWHPCSCKSTTRLLTWSTALVHS